MCSGQPHHHQVTLTIACFCLSPFACCPGILQRSSCLSLAASTSSLRQRCTQIGSRLPRHTWSNPDCLPEHHAATGLRAKRTSTKTRGRLGKESLGVFLPGAAAGGPLPFHHISAATGLQNDRETLAGQEIRFIGNLFCPVSQSRWAHLNFLARFWESRWG